MNVPLPSPAPPKPPFADRVERLDELVALAVLPEREPPGRRAVDLGRRPRVQPDRDPLVDVGDLLVRADAAGDEQPDARRRRTRAAPSRCRASRGRSRSRGAPSRGRSTRRARACSRPRSRAAGRGPSSRPCASTSRFSRRYAARKTIRKIFASSPGWNCERADVHPEPRAVDRRAEARARAAGRAARSRRSRRGTCTTRARGSRGAGRERGGEERDADHDPEPLLERVVGAEPVDLGHADRGQEPGHRQQVRVGVRHREARDQVRREVEREEEERVAERAPADDRLARDVDATRSRGRSGCRRREVERARGCGG